MPGPAAGGLPGLVARAAAARPDAPALLSPAGDLTWAELARAVDARAAGLLARGLAAGDRVALHLDNVLDFPVTYLAVLRAGLVAVPVGVGLAPPEVAHVVSDSGARLVVTSEERRAAVPEGVDAVLAGDPALAGEPGSLDLPERDPEELAVLLYTSGTSGRPKGAMLSSRALLANLEQITSIDPPVVTPDDVVLLVLPLTHVYGLNTALGATLHQGATGVLVPRFDPVGTLELVQRHGVTCVVGAPPMYAAWSLLPEAADALRGVRLALSGAAPLPLDVAGRFADVTGHHVFEGYGLTETAPALTSTVLSDVPRAGSLGRPLPGVDLQLLDEAGAPVEDDDPGEITVRGPNLFSGYWPDGSDGPDADGWWRTGDLAFWGADGDLHLVDRRKELVLVSGFNVYPAEVERVLLAHPEVVDAAAIGVPHPYTGETVKAYVVPRGGVPDDPGALVDSVMAHCAARLARFKCPTAVEVVASLPHSATGKVRKGRLRDPEA